MGLCRSPIPGHMLGYSQHRHPKVTSLTTVSSQELEMLKEQSRVKELEHEEELQTLRSQASQG